MGSESPSDGNRIAFALDVPDLGIASNWIDRLADHVGVFKVGLELYTAAGPAAVAAVLEAGAECFLDLKLHDIPATMARATRAAGALGVRYLTVHALAGGDALTAVAAERAPEMKLLAVTVLTSHSERDLQALGFEHSPQAATLRLAKLAQGADVDGLVCSAEECAALRAQLGADVTLVVPGIRPAGADHGDQQRVATPTAAIHSGADLLVVGRPIRDAPDPVAAAERIVAEVDAALSSGGER